MVTALPTNCPIILIRLLSLKVPLFLLLFLLYFVLELENFGQFKLLPGSDVHLCCPLYFLNNYFFQ